MKCFFLSFFSLIAIIHGIFHLNAEELQFLSDPFLQLPTSNTVRVVWFTSSEGSAHWVEWGEDGKHCVQAKSRSLSRIRKDIKQDDGTIIGCSVMPVWRHEAVVNGLIPSQRQPYRVISKTLSDSITSQWFTLACAPEPGQPLKILLTSDHQGHSMVAPNLQKAAETIGHFDAVFCAGDLVAYADRYDDWFLDSPAFFPCIQGNVKGKNYKGGEIIQHAFLFPAIGNHEVMGRYSLNSSIDYQINDPYPRDKAKILYPNVGEKELKELSFNTDTYEEIFTLPKNLNGNSTYYAITLGEIRLVVLYATRIWRRSSPTEGYKGKYEESQSSFDHPEQWGYGEFIFESLCKDSNQYNWLLNELQSESFQQAKLRIVMLHHPFHSLGRNSIPPFVDPVQNIRRDESGKIIAIDYSYPKNQDILIHDIEPLLESYGVDLVLCGHTHLWNRFQSPQGMHFLETSNVGNSYGAYTTQNGKQRSLPVIKDNKDHYALKDDPNGLEPIIPSLAPIKDEKGNPQPYIASNNITVFSVLDTKRKVIDSYYFDCLNPELGVTKFDSFCPYRIK